MSKKQYKSQASSSRAAFPYPGTFGGSGFDTNRSSVLSYVQEPPQISSIGDPNVAVAFKNLTKKDETTKAKALEDLQGFVTSVDGYIDDSFLEIWPKLFPRLSIDNSRRVRQLSHVVNGQICSKGGRRTAKHMSRISGPWLAGTFDSDRNVSRAASDALNLVFPTSEKIQGVRKAFQRSTLEYCRDAALYENASTLSDKRVVSADDAEATYSRVVATSLSVVGSLIQELEQEVIDKEFQIYEEIFAEPRLWDFAHYSDNAVRRSMHRLVQICLKDQPKLIEENLKTVSNAYVYKGLHSDQTGSALDFIQTLVSLTVALPTVWTDAYTGKRPPLSRLRHFVKQGSQSSSSEFWESLSSLSRVLPAQVLPKDQEDAADLLSAARTGVSRREDRFHASAAWPSYFTLADVVTCALPDEDANSLLETHVMPVLKQYLYPSTETSDWSISGAKSAWIVSQITIARKTIHLIVSEWMNLTDTLIETAKLSQPEQSKDFDKSQRHVASTGERWADLQREFWDSKSSETLAGCLAEASNAVLQACMSLLKSRNGKPYGAAATIEQLLRNCARRLMENDDFKNAYLTFAENDIPGMMNSPSQRHLVHGLYAIRSESAFQNIFATLLSGVITSSLPDEQKLGALRTIFTLNIPTEAISISRGDSDFQKFLLQSLSNERFDAGDKLFTDLIKLDAVTPETTDAILSKLMSTMMASEEPEIVLTTMNAFTETSPKVIEAFTSKSGGAGEHLLPNLLKLEQSPNDDIAEKAASLSSRLSTAMSETTSDAKYTVVLQNLQQISGNSLSVDAVHDLLTRIIGPEKRIQDALEMIPSTAVWLSALRKAVRHPWPSMAILSPMGGAVYLLPADASPSRLSQFDAEGLSQAFRISLYVTKLLSDTDLFHHLGDMGPIVISMLHISVLAAQDNLSIVGMNDFWNAGSGQDGENAAMEFISEANKVLKEYWKTTEPGSDSDSPTGFTRLWQAIEMLRDQEASSSLSYYVSLSSIEMHENIFNDHGFPAAQVKESEVALRERRAAKHTSLQMVEFITAFQSPLAGTTTIDRYCNELVADLTDLDLSDHEQTGLEKLIVLNSILHTQDHVTAGTAKQRLIFLVKRIVTWLDPEFPLTIRVEVCKTLAEVLPDIDDIYGEHWEQILSFLITAWSSKSNDIDNEPIRETDVLLVHASLRLFKVLKRISKYDEPNDDLVDALKDKEGDIRDALIHLLESSDGIADDTNQPLMLTNDLLARQLRTLPPKPLKSAEALYPLMYTPSQVLVQAAFDLLHTDIPRAQEEISFDAALDNKTARLPDELLSLILEAPTLESLADASFDRMMPLSLQGYLYSWRLLFDHFNGSSYKVKNDYIEQLKEGTYLDELLDFTFAFLGHRSGKPVDVSKFDIQNYEPDSEPTPEKDVQWLLTHIYYLALTHLPSLVKTYYLSIRSRQTSATIESWTAKYISPLIISASLEAVAQWAENSVKDDPEYEKMSVKVGMRSKEINVSYIVDEQTMAIKVVLPDAYPLASAQVLGVSRVAVKEEKWQSWLRNCQGVITFSNGSIIDGLTAWRKNVTGALKGQTECAICYSIISADKQLPTKRCPTCKNLFHSSCLLKWFKTSNASTCPLCRNPFNFN